MVEFPCHSPNEIFMNIIVFPAEMYYLEVKISVLFRFKKNTRVIAKFQIVHLYSHARCILLAKAVKEEYAYARRRPTARLSLCCSVRSMDSNQTHSQGMAQRRRGRERQHLARLCDLVADSLLPHLVSNSEGAGIW